MRFNYCYYIKGQTHIIDIANEQGTTSMGKTKEEILSRYPDAELWLWDQASEEIRQVNKRNYLDANPVEITEDDFHEMLNVLPPQKWVAHESTESFFLSEAMTDDIHSVFVRIKEKFYRLYARRTDKHEQIIERVKAVAA